MSVQASNDESKVDDSNSRTRTVVPQTRSGMTPSILTTINNTSPHPPTNRVNSMNNNSNSIITKGSKRTSEPYESYIEDSFVGHWEHEDDDPLYEYGQHGLGNDPNETGDDDESTLHPSTIEFDFDSFGPESIIYAPNATKPADLKVEPETVDDKHTDILSTLDVTKLQLNEKGVHDKDIAQTNTGTQDQSTAIKTDETTLSPEPQEKQTVSTTQVDDKPRASSRQIEMTIDHIVDPTQIDLKVIEPYKKVISHAGYCHHFDSSAPAPKPGETAPAIIVFSACYLPDRSRRDYNYVMDHLFLYVLSSLHELIADDYILIYLHNTQPYTSSTSGSSSSTLLQTGNGSTTASSSSADDVARNTTLHQNNLPTFSWMKRCYQMIDRKLRKNLKILYLVKPTFWLKTIVIMCKPFISSKFSKKLRFIEDMEGLKACLPLDQLILPASADRI